MIVIFGADPSAADPSAADMAENDLDSWLFTQHQYLVDQLGASIDIEAGLQAIIRP